MVLFSTMVRQDLPDGPGGLFMFFFCFLALFFLFSKLSAVDRIRDNDCHFDTDGFGM